MDSTMVVVVAIGLALLIVAAVYGLASSTIDIGDTAVGNFSGRAQPEEEGGTDFLSSPLQEGDGLPRAVNPGGGYA
ncbi:MAG: hypothetical protein ABEI58_04090 [Candidatus Nanohaloarchaea archaeon]